MDFSPTMRSVKRRLKMETATKTRYLPLRLRNPPRRLRRRPAPLMAVHRANMLERITPSLGPMAIMAMSETPGSLSQYQFGVYGVGAGMYNPPPVNVEPGDSYLTDLQTNGADLSSRLTRFSRMASFICPRGNRINHRMRRMLEGDSVDNGRTRQHDGAPTRQQNGLPNANDEWITRLYDTVDVFAAGSNATIQDDGLHDGRSYLTDNTLDFSALPAGAPHGLELYLNHSLQPGTTLWLDFRRPLYQPCTVDIPIESVGTSSLTLNEQEIPSLFPQLYFTNETTETPGSVQLPSTLSSYQIIERYPGHNGETQSFYEIPNPDPPAPGVYGPPYLMSYAQQYGGNLIKEIINDQRPGTGNVSSRRGPVDDPTGIPNSRIIHHGYELNNSAYIGEDGNLTTFRTSTYEASAVGTGTKYIVDDYDINPQIQTGTLQQGQVAGGNQGGTFSCDTPPSAFNLGLYPVEDDGRVRRHIEYGWEYDATGNPFCRVRVTQYSYQAGQLLSVSGPKTDGSDTITYTYYGTGSSYVGRLETISQAGLTITFNRYSALGGVLQITDANGNLWTMTRDAMDRILSIQDPQSNITRYGYGLKDTPNSITHPDGNVDIVTYDALGRPIEIDRKPNASSNTILDSVSYNNTDVLGNVIDGCSNQPAPSSALSALLSEDNLELSQVSMPSPLNCYGEPVALTITHDGYITYSANIVYDQYRHPKSIVLNRSENTANTISPSYTVLGDLVNSMDPNHALTGSPNRFLTYDALRNLTSDAWLNQTGQQVTMASATYDTKDELDAISHPSSGDTPTASGDWAYDDFGDIGSYTGTEMGTTHYTYDVAGNRASEIDANGSTKSFSYDGLNRVTSIAFTNSVTQSSDPTISYTWDRLSGDTPPSDCITQQAVPELSNGAGLKVKESRGGTGGDSYYYGYTALGQLATIAHVAPNAGCSDVTSYSYDGNGNVLSISYPVEDRTYRGQHRAVGYVYGSGGDPDAVQTVELLANINGSMTAYKTLLEEINHSRWGNDYTWIYDSTNPVLYELLANTDGTPSSLVAYQNFTAPEYLVNRRYTEDPNGNLTGSIDNVIGPATSIGSDSVPSDAIGFRTDTYTYDYANRLTGDANSLGDAGYALDQVGRITGTSFASGAEASALGLPSETATTSVTYNPTNGMPGAANETDVEDGVTDDEQDVPMISTDLSGNVSGMTQNDTGADDLSHNITLGTDESQHLDSVTDIMSEDGVEVASVGLTHQADSQFRQTQEAVSGAMEGGMEFYYGSGGKILSVDNTLTSDCLGQAVSDERQDFVYLYGRPVAVLFSTSDNVASPDCGLNFIVPNHLGAPMRLLDGDGNVTQSPETGPYGGVGGTGWNHSNGPQYGDILARFDPGNGNALVPFGRNWRKFRQLHRPGMRRRRLPGHELHAIDSGTGGERTSTEHDHLGH